MSEWTNAPRLVIHFRHVAAENNRVQTVFLQEWKASHVECACSTSNSESRVPFIEHVWDLTATVPQKTAPAPSVSHQAQKEGQKEAARGSTAFQDSAETYSCEWHRIQQPDLGRPPSHPPRPCQPTLGTNPRRLSGVFICTEGSQSCESQHSLLFPTSAGTGPSFLQMLMAASSLREKTAGSGTGSIALMFFARYTLSPLQIVPSTAQWAAQ